MFKQRRAMTLIGTSSLMWKRYLHERIAEYDLTLKQLYLLNQLSKNDYLLPSAIAEGLYCDRPTATVIIRNTEKKGYIRTESHPDDRRSKRIVITELGRTKLAAIQEADIHTVDPLSPLTEEEIQTLTNLMTKVNDFLKGVK